MTSGQQAGSSSPIRRLEQVSSAGGPRERSSHGHALPDGGARPGPVWTIPEARLAPSALRPPRGAAREPDD
eukprot:10032167-Alexandrium_andersonii.AAC.1